MPAAVSGGTSVTDTIYTQLMAISRTLGEQSAQLAAIQSTQTEERETARAHRMEVRERVQDVELQLAEVTHSVKPLVEATAAHAKTLEVHTEEIREGKLFRSKVGGVVAVAASGLTLSGSGLIYLANKFQQEIWDFFRWLFTRS